jgi:hypothetical protein
MEFFKSEKQRISYRDAGVVFLLLFVIVVMTFDEAMAGMPHAEKLQNDILPIIALTLGAITAILFVKANNEIYYLKNVAQNLASWHSDPLNRIDDFEPFRYGEERDTPRSVVLYLMMTKDMPDPELATGWESYYRHVMVAQINIRKTAARALDLHGPWRELYLALKTLEQRFMERFPRVEEADSRCLYHLRTLLLYLYARGGKAALREDVWNGKIAGRYLENASDFPELDEQQRSAVADFYRRIAEEEPDFEGLDQGALLSAAGIGSQ